MWATDMRQSNWHTAGEVGGAEGGAGAEKGYPGRVYQACPAESSSGRSRGFGTVKYATKEDALAAVDAMHNAVICDRTITVRIDKFA
ncbi:hypothetical protein WJX72_000684 [[Myrmecia] bisecta]|uniref:RRM domain-containing protein n=1 Tax=[Myrmecia] bisecta TaxID=41462 RepID=A0AAW1P393_9CHLO